MRTIKFRAKKRECWENFKFARRPLNTDKKIFDFIFDRAYAIGNKQKEIITQEEIEKAAKKYAAEVDKNIRDLYGSIPDAIIFGDCAAESFREGVKFALGKQEKGADTVIQGWAAIDEAFNQCFLHTEKPIQKAQPIADTGDYDTVWDSEGKTYLLDNSLFPDMDSDSEPQEVEITIKRKKKNL